MSVSLLFFQECAYRPRSMGYSLSRIASISALYQSSGQYESIVVVFVRRSVSTSLLGIQGGLKISQAFWSVRWKPEWPICAVRTGCIRFCTYVEFEVGGGERMRGAPNYDCLSASHGMTCKIYDRETEGKGVNEVEMFTNETKFGIHMRMRFFAFSALRECPHFRRPPRPPKAMLKQCTGYFNED